MSSKGSEILFLHPSLIWERLPVLEISDNRYTMELFQSSNSGIVIHIHLGKHHLWILFRQFLSNCFIDGFKALAMMAPLHSIRLERHTGV